MDSVTASAVYIVVKVQILNRADSAEVGPGKRVLSYPRTAVCKYKIFNM